MDVSIVIVNHQNPEIIENCLRTLDLIEDISYEVVVVDNGSDKGTVELLRHLKTEGLIDTLVEEQTNRWFSEGNNIGVRHSDPSSKYILLLNSDVAFYRGDWLTKQVGWMEGTIKAKPGLWGFQPTKVKPGPFDIVSIGWSYDPTVLPGNKRPEGWCCMIRRSVWQDISPDFPFYHGLEEMIAKAGHAGARIGVLSQYSKYLVHAEGGSRAEKDGKKTQYAPNARKPDLAGWMKGLEVEGLDFTLGPKEHFSYMEW